MKRSRLTIDDVAEWNNLMQAFGRAALGKRGRADVEAYRSSLDTELDALHRGLLDGTYPLGSMRRFRIRDPKPRLIHAPCFAERVLHHALMAKMGPVLESTLVFDTYACREGKGAHAAVRRVQDHARRWTWYVQIDIRHYFPSVDHEGLMGLLRRKFSDHDLLDLVKRILAMGADVRGRGLPIGALTSQGFANAYLGPVDRLLLEHKAVRGYVRYMDDMIWYGDDKAGLQAALTEVVGFLDAVLHLQVKRPFRSGQSRNGISFCGYRVHRDRLLLSRRRKRRYSLARRKAEALFIAGNISAPELQRRMDAVLAVTAHSDSVVWRREQLHRAPIASSVTEA